MLYLMCSTMCNHEQYYDQQVDGLLRLEIRIRQRVALELLQESGRQAASRERAHDLRHDVARHPLATPRREDGEGDLA